MLGLLEQMITLSSTVWSIVTLSWLYESNVIIPPLLDFFLQETNPSEEFLNSSEKKAFFGVSQEIHEAAKAKGYRHTFPMEGQTNETFHYVKSSGIVVINSCFSSEEKPLEFMFFHSSIMELLTVGECPDFWKEKIIDFLVRKHMRVEVGGSPNFSDLSQSQGEIRTIVGPFSTFLAANMEEVQVWRRYEAPPEPFSWRQPMIGDTRFGQPRREIYLWPDCRPIPEDPNDGVIREYVLFPWTDAPRFVRGPFHWETDRVLALYCGVGVDLYKINYVFSETSNLEVVMKGSTGFRLRGEDVNFFLKMAYDWKLQVKDIQLKGDLSIHNLNHKPAITFRIQLT